MSRYMDIQKPYKYLINTIIMQRKGANAALVHNNYYDL
jgi:hypothetical protein